MRSEYSVFTWPYLLLKDLEPVTSGNRIPEPGVAIFKAKPVFCLRMSCPNQAQKKIKKKILNACLLQLIVTVQGT